MYALLIKNDNSLPTMISQQSAHFPDYIQSGYEIIKEGSKKEVSKVYEEMIVEFASNLD